MVAMKIGFTGTQRGMSLRQRDRLSSILSKYRGEFHHGDCIGADAESHALAIICGWKVILHPPIDNSKRAFCKGSFYELAPKEYLERNKDIVNNTEGLIVAPYTAIEILRSGTWSTKRYAEKIGKPFEILPR